MRFDRYRTFYVNYSTGNGTAVKLNFNDYCKLRIINHENRCIAIKLDTIKKTEMRNENDSSTAGNMNIATVESMLLQRVCLSI